jgi:hypothetical protein
MARFKCTNNDCELKDVIVAENKTRWTADSSGALKHSIRCSKCDSLLEYVPNERTGEDINIHFAAFSSKSPEEKKEILKKRASEHNRTKMKDRTIEIRRRLTRR